MRFKNGCKFSSRREGPRQVPRLWGGPPRPALPAPGPAPYIVHPYHDHSTNHDTPHHPITRPCGTTDNDERPPAWVLASGPLQYVSDACTPFDTEFYVGSRRIIDTGTRRAAKIQDLPRASSRIFVCLPSECGDGDRRTGWPGMPSIVTIEGNPAASGPRHTRHTHCSCTRSTG